jgi:hypothetical protein
MIEDRAPRRGQDQVAIHACLQQDWFTDCLMEPRRSVHGPQAFKVTWKAAAGVAQGCS